LTTISGDSRLLAAASEKSVEEARLLLNGDSAKSVDQKGGY